MIGQFLGHGVVDSLGHLIHETGDVTIDDSALVGVERSVEQLAESPGTDVLVGDTPLFNLGRNDRVAEAEGGRKERNGQIGIGFRVVFRRQTLQFRELNSYFFFKCCRWFD